MKPKVVFLNLHGVNNITAAYLHKILEKSNYPTRTIHFRRLVPEFISPSKQELNSLKKVLDKLNPKYILMSVNSISFLLAQELVKILKDRIVIWGGIHPLIDPEACLKHVKYIVRGEGEEAMLELLDALEQNKSPNKIKNVWINKNNKIIKNPFRPLVQDISNLEIPKFEEEHKIYILGDKIYKKNPLPHLKYNYHIAFSRGCPFSCKYCLNHLLNKMFDGKYLRRKSVESSIKELLIAKNKFPKLKKIHIWDDVFITDKKWLTKFIKQYKKHINLPFFSYGNASCVDWQTMKMLKKAGLCFFDIGIQSGSSRIRKDIFGRVDGDEQILKANKILHKLKIPTGYDLIYSEFETEKDMEIGLRFLLKLKKPFKIHINKLAYYNDFEITQRALAEKKISQKDIAGKSDLVNTQETNKQSSQENPLLNYYYFLGKRFIPNWSIKYMHKNQWHIKNKKLLASLGFFVNNLYNKWFSLKGMWEMVLRGEFAYMKNRIFNKKEFMPY
jgi:anaerobic magnesium-protoporphyrin IX monomethyl ester cyclase